MNCLDFDLLDKIERYFLDNDEPLTCDIKGFSDVMFYRNFLPLNKNNVDQKTLQKYGFKSTYELANDFWQNRYNHEDALPEEFKNGTTGYIYPFLSAFDKTHRRHYIFSFFRHLFSSGETLVSIFYADIKNDYGAREYGKYNEVFLQAKGYRWLNPESEFYDDKLALEVAEILVSNLAKILNFIVYDEPKPAKVSRTNADDLARFLALCGVDEDFIAKNSQKIFKNLKDIYGDDELCLFNVLCDESLSAHSDYKFDSDDVREFIKNLALDTYDFNPLKDIRQDDLIPCFREFLKFQGFWLCNFETGSDSYLFLAFSLDDIDEVMSLARRLKLPLQDFFS